MKKTYIMIALTLLAAWCAAATMTVEPSAIQAIAFPADRTTFANGSAVPSTLHVLCGWWDRADSFETDPLHGSCDFVGADYANAPNVSCYASDPRLALDRVSVTCAVAEQAESWCPEKSRYGVVQDSCALVIDAAHWQAPATTFRAPDTHVPMDERSMYDRARHAYAHLLDHQIVAHRSAIKAHLCRINGTRAIEFGQRLVANVHKLHKTRISVSKALDLLTTPKTSEQDALDVLHCAFAIAVEVVVMALVGAAIVLAVFALFWIATAVRWVVLFVREFGAFIIPASFIMAAAFACFGTFVARIVNILLS